MLRVVVITAGEFIVGLQIVRPDFDSLGFGVTAEIDSHVRGRGSLLFAQQKRNRRRSWSIPFQRLIDGAAQCGRAIQVQQFEQLRGLAARRLPLREGEVDECFAFRRGQCQTTSGSCVESLALRLQHCFLMSRIQDQLMAVVSAWMAGDLRRTFEDSHQRVRGDKRQLATDGFGRNRVVVEIKTNIDRFAARTGRTRSVWKG